MLNRAYSESELSVLLTRLYGLPPPWENENHRLKKVPLGGDTVDVSEFPARKLVAMRAISHCLQGFFSTSQVVVWDFFHQQYVSSLKEVNLPSVILGNKKNGGDA